MPATITITEALAEIKTILARVGKKREAVLRYLVRDSRLRDPMAADGGTAEFVRRERQAIGDLEDRMIRLRLAIQEANLRTTLAVAAAERLSVGMSHTVAYWLNWRREVSQNARGFVGAMTTTLASARAQAQKQGLTVAEKDSGSAVAELIVSVNEKELTEASEVMETVLGELDGKLSLLNATTSVEVD